MLPALQTLHCSNVRCLQPVLLLAIVEAQRFTAQACSTGCPVGTLLVTLSDNSSGSSTPGAAAAAAAAPPPGTLASAGGPANSVFGDMLCLISACLHASYTIVLRKSLPDGRGCQRGVILWLCWAAVLRGVAPVVAVLAGWGSLHLKIIPAQAYLIIFVEGEVGCGPAGTASASTVPVLHVLGLVGLASWQWCCQAQV